MEASNDADEPSASPVHELLSLLVGGPCVNEKSRWALVNECRTTFGLGHQIIS